MKENNNKIARNRIGWIIFVVLAVFTIVEFLIGAYVQPAALYLVFTALIKAWLIIYYFMHVAQLWRKDGEHE